MEAFIEHGYAKTSIQILVEAMAINRGSLYDTFGDKEELFLAALEHYFLQRVLPRLNAINAVPSPLEGIHRFLQGVVTDAISPTGHFGCMLTNTAAEVGATDERVRENIQNYWQFMEDALHKQLQRAADLGEIEDIGNLRAKARFLLTMLQGVRVVSKFMRSERDLREIVNTGLGALNTTLDGIGSQLGCDTSKGARP